MHVSSANGCIMRTRTECPYPHISGTSKPVTPERWMLVSGEPVEADQDSMREHVVAAHAEARRQRETGVEMDEELPWSSEEELFISRPVSVVEPEKSSSSVVKGLAFVALACSMSVTIMHMLSAGREAVGTSFKPKVSV